MDEELYKAINDLANEVYGNNSTEEVIEELKTKLDTLSKQQDANMYAECFLTFLVAANKSDIWYYELKLLTKRLLEAKQNHKFTKQDDGTYKLQ